MSTKVRRHNQNGGLDLNSDMLALGRPWCVEPKRNRLQIFTGSDNVAMRICNEMSNLIKSPSAWTLRANREGSFLFLEAMLEQVQKCALTFGAIDAAGAVGMESAP